MSFARIGRSREGERGKTKRSGTIWFHNTPAPIGECTPRVVVLGCVHTAVFPYSLELL